jgi:hypothetical protein
MHVDLTASKRVASQLARAHGGRVKKLQAKRRSVDERFDPAKALDATGRYLTLAKSKLGGRSDLAFESYHMGIGNLQGALGAYGSGNVSYARLYFDSTPLQHKSAYDRLAALGDDSATYLWRLLAARDIMRLYRTNRAQLASLAALHNRKATAEEVLHPLAQTQVFASPTALTQAIAGGTLRPLPDNAGKLFFQIDPSMGEFAARFHQPRSTYRALRPEALALLVYLASGVHAISGQSPLVITSSARDVEYQKLLVGSDIQATHNYSLHTTGFAFDVARQYHSLRQAKAFQFMLNRLLALNLIAYAVEPEAIHITVSSDASVLEPLLPR